MELTRKKFFKIKEDDEFLVWITKQNWVGEGTARNPFLIEEINDENEKILISKTKFYIIFKHSNIGYLKLKSCKNIEICNSMFKILSLNNCVGFLLKGVDVVSLGLVSTKECRFTDCVIHNFVNQASYANIFENCLLSSEAKNSIAENTFDILSHIKILTILFIVWIPIFIITFFDFNFGITLIFLFIYIGICLISLFIILQKNREIKRNPNKIIKR